MAINPGRKFTAASRLRLAGPAIDAAGVTLGGASVDEFGRCAPAMNEEVLLTGDDIIVDVPAASAALVSLSGNRSSAQSAAELRLLKIAIQPREGAVSPNLPECRRDCVPVLACHRPIRLHGATPHFCFARDGPR